MGKIIKKKLSELEEPSDEIIEQIKAMSDEDINFSDIPEVSYDENSYRPVKQRVSIWLDKDVIAHFKARGNDYQAHINSQLREIMNKEKGSEYTE